MKKRKYKSKGKIKEHEMTECTPLINDPLIKVSFGKETTKEV